MKRENLLHHWNRFLFKLSSTNATLILMGSYFANRNEMSSSGRQGGPPCPPAYPRRQQRTKKSRASSADNFKSTLLASNIALESRIDLNNGHYMGLTAKRHRLH